MLESVWLTCPYCGEAFETEVDCSPGGQRYIEDCPVCCRPIEVGTDVGVDGALAGVQVRRDDE
jgi:hypothetical protein